MNVVAIDVGFGTTSVAWSRDEYTVFPSKAVLTTKAKIQQFNQMGMARRESIFVTVGDQIFEVGPGVNEISNGATERNITKSNIGSPKYRALYLGALAQLPKEIEVVDLLVGGLPLNMLHMKKDVINFMAGEHMVGDRKIIIKDVHILPQPYGALTYHASRVASSTGSTIMNVFGNDTRLTVDPGYGTFDFLTTTALTPDESRSGAVELGQGKILAQCSQYLSSVFRTEIGPEIIDQAFQKKSLRIFKDTFDFPTHEGVFDCIPVIDSVCKDAVGVLVNKVNSALDISEILVCGGPAKDYVRTLKETFPRHDIVLIENHDVAVCLGFMELAYQIHGALQSRKAAEVA